MALASFEPGTPRSRFLRSAVAPLLFNSDRANDNFYRVERKSLLAPPRTSPLRALWVETRTCGQILSQRLQSSFETDEEKTQNILEKTRIETDVEKIQNILRKTRIETALVILIPELT